MGAFRTSILTGAILVAGLVFAIPGAVASTDQFAMLQDPTVLVQRPASTLLTMRSLGVQKVRVSAIWSSIAPAPRSDSQPRGFDPSDPASYPAANWAPLDAIVQDANQDGIQVELVLTTPAPRWATSGPAPAGGPLGVWEPSAYEYGLFVRAIATRYSGTYTPTGAASPLPAVSSWELGNEPNWGFQLAPQATHNSRVATSPSMYRALVDAGWSALQSTGHGGDTVVIGNLAPRGLSARPSPGFPQGFPGRFSTTKPLIFTRLLYCLNRFYRPLRGGAARSVGCPTTAAGSRRFPVQNPALFKASGFGMHPYPHNNTPPNTPGEADRNNVDIATIGRLETALNRAQEAYLSSRQLPVYNTEFGYITAPPNTPKYFVSPATAAVYLNWAEYRSYIDPRIANTMNYELYDPNPKSSGFESGLIFFNGRHKATYDAYRMPIWVPTAQTVHGQSQLVWGCVRPAPFAAADTGLQQDVQIQFQSVPGGPFATLSTFNVTDPHGYLETSVVFPGSGTIRLAWTYPASDPMFPPAVQGTTVYSRSVRITIR